MNMAALLSPLLSALSDKILLFIFISAIENVVTILPPQSQDVKLCLSQVSRRWRSLILETPMLWQYYKFYPQFVNHPTAMTCLTKTWLRRSRGSTLHLIFYDKPMGPSTLQIQPASADQLLFGHGKIDIIGNIILPFSAQIRTLQLVVSTEPVIKSFLKIPYACFPQLQAMDITLINDLSKSSTPFDDMERQAFTVFQDLPELRRARVHILNGIDPLYLRLPWAQLTILDLGSTAISPDTFMYIVLYTSFSLIDGRFHIKFTPCDNADVIDDSSDGLEPLIIETTGLRLQRLHLRLMNPSNDGRMFNYLRLPALQELKIDLYDPSCGWNVSIMNSILQRSENTLQVLMLTYWPPPTLFPDDLDKILSRRQRQTLYTELETLFSSLPNLRQIHLPLCLPIHFGTLEKFANGKLLPHLSVLSIGSLHAPLILQAVSRRNEVATNSLYQPGSSRMPRKPTLPGFLSYLKLSVREKDKPYVDQQLAFWRNDPHFEHTIVDIIGVDERYLIK